MVLMQIHKLSFLMLTNCHLTGLLLGYNTWYYSLIITHTANQMKENTYYYTQPNLTAVQKCLTKTDKFGYTKYLDLHNNYATRIYLL